MIGRLRGILVEKQPPHLLVEANGVGYEVEVPMTTLYRLPSLNEPVTLHTHLVVREDAHLLYGFCERRERELFRELIRLNGVGPKLALALMSSLELDELVRCVQAGDIKALTRVPGVGKKTAERLLIELKDRFKAWESLPTVASLTLESNPDIGIASAESDALSALVALGFKPQEASRAVAAVQEEGLSSEELIRRALRGMA
ncbi:Holliday junction branch migration protein RuvA [Azotobacter vinelandii]|uniref:Holliday junction branch migration protein RuvA n=1 Tax=Azotobacter TaxID=352 RepID=UPI0002E4018A|nr:Holliday junction branch migration protein RuvA [Azotobacter vinelandii]WKN20603.1 Holliday junction branch migration protein RuvA [Azotobacter vinelandii]GLK62372.1 Holliday junction ATP-dependent DNA helicase RuvA [Azotobacter vinelandii]SFX43093.1 Holliday junction DNA helicase subunit RuvA [Azotobacter vinelandii]